MKTRIQTYKAVFPALLFTFLMGYHDFVWAQDADNEQEPITITHDIEIEDDGTKQPVVQNTFHSNLEEINPEAFSELQQLMSQMNIDILKTHDSASLKSVDIDISTLESLPEDVKLLMEEMGFSGEMEVMLDIDIDNLISEEIEMLSGGEGPIKKVIMIDEDGEEQEITIKHFDFDGADWNVGNDAQVVIQKVIIMKMEIEDLELEEAAAIKKLDETTNGKTAEAKTLAVDALQVFPNPNQGVFQLQFNSAEKGKLTIRVADMQGQLLYEEIQKGFSGSYSNKVDLSEQPAGTYLLQIVHGKRVANKKLTIQ